jgi:hypothetical protein
MCKRVHHKYQIRKEKEKAKQIYIYIYREREGEKETQACMKARRLLIINSSMPLVKELG